MLRIKNKNTGTPPRVELCNSDYVLVNKQNEMLTYKDGEIVIFNSYYMAEKQIKLLSLIDYSSISCVKLSKRLRKLLRKNILKFRNT